MKGYWCEYYWNFVFERQYLDLINVDAGLERV